MKSKKKLVSTFLRLVIGFFLVVFVSLILAVFATWNSISFLKKQDFARTRTWVNVARLVVRPARKITGDLVAELVIWDESLNLLYNSETLAKAVKILVGSEPASLEERKSAHSMVESIIDELPTWGIAFHYSGLFDVKEIISSESAYQWFYLFRDAWKSEKPWLILLQNTDEVRATGGFIGSYAEVWFTPERFGEIEIRDIYDPDGLIFTELESPPGQKEYLSAGRGMRLPDANWEADFPTSAEQILWFFSQVENDPKDYQGVVAVNLSLVEDLVEVFGEVEVVDLDQPLTKENFSILAREDRVSFFAGSRQKTQFLNRAMVALRNRLYQANKEEFKKLQQLFSQALEKKDLQFYSPERSSQSRFEHLGIAGQLRSPHFTEANFYVVPIESNVGVNKANRLVTREFCYLNKFEKVELNYVFHNANKIEDRPTEKELANADHNLSPHLGYINYQRFLLGATDQIEKIIWDGEEIKNWDSRFITTGRRDIFKEIGFLFKLPEESSGTLKVIVAPWKMLNKDSEIFIEPQSGVEYLECADIR